MLLGRVDEVDGHFVATRFVALAIPTRCLYVAPNSPSRGGEGVRIRTDWRSVALGYARVWLPLLAVALPAAQAAAGHVRGVTWLVVATLLAGAAAAHRSGRLADAEKARLRLLGTVTGLRIDPGRLQPSMRGVKRDSLGELMDKGGIPTTPAEILAVLEDIPLPAVPLVYGYARYAGDDPAWRDCAEHVYARYEQGEY